MALDYLFLATRDVRLAETMRELGTGAARRSARAAEAVLHESGPGRLHLTAGARSAARFFDGVAVFGDRLVHEAEAVPSEAEGRGVYMRARHHPSGRVEISLDPLGLYPVFVRLEDDLTAVSNNVFMLADALGRLGRPPRKDPALYGWFVALGGAPDGATGFCDVRRLPAGGRLVVEPDGRARLETTPVAALLYADRPFEALLDEAAEEILANVRALAGGDYPERICDLSGGMDSRLVLAAILREGRRDDFVFHTNGSRADPDVKTAALLRAAHGLRRASGDEDSGEKSGEEDGAALLAPFDDLRRTVGRVQGLMSMFHKLPSMGERTGALRFGGGLGGLARRVWSSSFGVAGPALGALRRAGEPGQRLGRIVSGPLSAAAFRRSPLSGVARSMRTRSGLLCPDVDLAQRRAVFRRSVDLVLEGLADDHVGDAFYLQARSPYHVGVWWRAAAPFRFHPLYSVAMIRAAHTLPEEERADNRVGFELMRRLHPELTRAPFAEKAWSPRLMPDAPPPITWETPPPPWEDASGPRRHAAPKPRPSRRERTLMAKGANARQLKLARTLDDFHARFPEPDFSALGDVFRTEALDGYFRRDGTILDKREARTAFRVLGAHVWMNDLETTEG